MSLGVRLLKLDPVIWPLSPIVVRFLAENRQKILVLAIRRAKLEYERDKKLQKKVWAQIFPKSYFLSCLGRGASVKSVRISHGRVFSWFLAFLCVLCVFLDFQLKNDTVIKPENTRKTLDLYVGKAQRVEMPWFFLQKKIRVRFFSIVCFYEIWCRGAA